jgi:hypothetical protein
VLFLVSAVLGLVSMGSSLLLVGLVLDSPNSGSLFQSWHLPVPVRLLWTLLLAALCWLLISNFCVGAGSSASVLLNAPPPMSSTYSRPTASWSP